MTDAHAHVDKPEPRWQALLAMAAVGGVYLALPRELVIGPTWLLPTVIAVLLAPTILTHRMERHSFNHALGIVNNGIITVALIGSVSLLVATLASHKEPPLRLLRSGAELWLTNVLVFSLWYWRLDGGGPNVRDQHPEFGSRSFVFPQMQIKKASVNDLASNAGGRVLSITFLSPSRKAPPSDHRCTASGSLGEATHYSADFHFAEYRHTADLARRWSPLNRHPRRSANPGNAGRIRRSCQVLT